MTSIKTDKKNSIVDKRQLIFFVFVAIISTVVISSMPLSIMDCRLEFMTGALKGSLKESLNYINGVSDFRTVYVYAAVIARLFKINKATTMFALIQEMQMMSGMLIVPVVFSLIFHNKKLNWFIPLIVLLAIWPLMYYGVGDTYSSLVFPVIIGMPIIVYLFRTKWDKKTWFLLVIVWMVIATGNIVRSHSSLGILICLIAVIVYKAHNDKLQMLGLIVVSMFSYSLFAQLVPELVYHVCGVESHLSDWGFGPWHSIYIGIGFERNPFNISYNDSCAMEYVKSVDPTIKNMTPEYAEVLKNKYFQLVFDNKIYFIRSYIRKACLCMEPIFLYACVNFVFSIMTIISVFVHIKNRMVSLYVFETRFISYLFLVCYLTSMLPEMIAIPEITYGRGTMAVVAVASLLFVLNYLNSVLSMKQ